MSAIAVVAVEPAAAEAQAHLLLEPGSAVSRDATTAAVAALLREMAAVVVARGWTPGDLGQLVRRRLGAAHLGLLADLLVAEERRHPPDRVPDEWRAEREALGPAVTVDGRTPSGLARLLRMAALLSRLPRVETVLPAPGTATRRIARAPGRADSRQLARVRALLAKAESTEYDQEAESLSAKAQELISRYALEQLVREQPSGDAASDEAVVVRRLWLDPPYQMAKGLLVQVVAGANRCRSLLAAEFGFSTVVGVRADGEWVELVSTSLLVQADRAMLRHGRQVDWSGRSRTRSFRGSFLVAYATRIGQRLRSATEQATHATEARATGTELVPLLRQREQLVEEAYARMPSGPQRTTQVSNGAGWAAGTAAADLALLSSGLQPLPDTG